MNQNIPIKTLGEVLLDFFSVVAKRKRHFTVFVLGVTVLTAGIVSVLPKWYKATASVFPAESADLFGGLGGISSLVSSISPVKKLSSLTGASELDRYIAILKSERALTAVIQKFDLVKVYEISKYTREKSMKELLSNVDIEQSDEGSLLVSVYDKEPQRAADMANFFVEMLNEINSELHVQNARANRNFIEQRYNKNLADIQTAQDAFKKFQLETGVVAVPEQIEASIKVAADLYAHLNIKEIELAILDRTVSTKHPSYNEKLIEVQELRRQLHGMNEGSSAAANDMKILLPFKQTPALGAEYLRLYRDVEIQYKILQFIAPLYEQAKVEENRSTPSVVVLDHASVPEMKAKPKILLYSLLAFVASS
ncbi:MAG TPA: Wzz/FepE/Etk N-terminal domain-containing protein, partial [Candidatus Hodarchaeales archaeon]|nr:Wzz/FepE/Etk N-terminal domain-containing protein [Candidatus Hodarchaeales archaeon]